ncbi:hypothetical protein AVEN_26949-1 [Araneus ventricosus]|uniref:Uncharacterized protein n=1 Tax=Araneus ventricosus TaxID=182803 RepID=A0A4Y2JMI3_ARAVE|nr:hypothetical protein AVEN_26949-1 [Araneus ventricosus]
MKGDITHHLINEVAAFIPGEHFTTLDIAVLAHDDELAKVADAYTFYDASRYPLNFRIIQGGYHFKIFLINPNKSVTKIVWWVYVNVSNKQDKKKSLFRENFSKTLT